MSPYWPTVGYYKGMRLPVKTVFREWSGEKSCPSKTGSGRTEGYGMEASDIIPDLWKGDVLKRNTDREKQKVNVWQG